MRSLRWALTIITNVLTKWGHLHTETDLYRRKIMSKDTRESQCEGGELK